MAFFNKLLVQRVFIKGVSLARLSQSNGGHKSPAARGGHIVTIRLPSASRKTAYQPL
jgi:hypothetical protein